jgi:hypothetical protein
MRLDKLKKEIRFSMRDLFSPDTMATKFLLCPDDNELINRINKHDESALFQFAMKHIQILVKSILKDRVQHDNRLMDLYFPCFIEQIKVYAKTYQDKTLPEFWYLSEFPKICENEFYPLSAHLREEHTLIWRDFEITDRHIDFLNHLNDFLLGAEDIIVERAKTEIPVLEAIYRNPKSLTTEYEYFVDVSYYSSKTDGNPIYEVSRSFGNHSILKNKWGLLCDSEDWRESGWLPALKNRCCYLMHELVYHACLCEQIFDIDDIWIDTKVWNQSMHSYKNNGWAITKFPYAGYFTSRSGHQNQ